MKTEISCPICSSDLPLNGDERKGEQVFCTVCGAPLRLKGDAGAEDLDVDEDY